MVPPLLSLTYSALEYRSTTNLFEKHELIETMFCWTICLLCSLYLYAQVVVIAEPYVGEQCNGVFANIPVNLTHSSIDSEVIDRDVYGGIYYLYNLSVWNTQACVSSLRRHYCMLALSKYSYQTYYCKENCLDLGPDCSYYYELAQEYYPEQSQLIYEPCQQLPSENPYCFPGSPAKFTEREPVCPLPFVIPDAASFERDDLIVYWIWGTACAFPCQPVIYSDSQWNNMKTMFASTFFIAFVFSFLLLANSIITKHYNLAMFSLGTTNGAFWMTIFTNLNADNELICHGNAGVDQYNPFCVFTGFMLLASLNWFSAWSFNITFKVWASVSRKISSLTLKKINKYYWILAIFLPSLIFINLGVGNIGYEYVGGTSCICYNLYEIQPKYWHYITTFTPVIIFAVILPGFLLLDTLRIVITSKTPAFRGSRKSTSTSMSTQPEVRSESQPNSVPTIRSISLMDLINLRKTLKIPEEQWSILKFIVFGVSFTMFFCISDLIATYQLDPKTIINDASVCVLLAATTDPNEGLNVCGEGAFEINGIWTVYAIVAYGGIFGTIPLLIFGIKPLRKLVMKRLKILMKQSLGDDYLKYDNDRSDNEGEKKSNEMSDMGDSNDNDEGRKEATQNPMNEDCEP